MTKKHIILGGAGLMTLVTAATFVVFSAVIIPKLGRLDDREYIQTMQKINRDIQNPWFLGSFLGAALLVPVSVYLFKKSGSATQVRLLAAASLLYIIGTFGITSAVNVPLNDKLDKVSVTTTSPSELATTRNDYESNWNKWHTARTVTAVAALGAIIGAIVIAKPTKNKEK